MIPDSLRDFITACPTEFAFPVESYLGIPLWSQGKCFGHLGCFWTLKGLERRKLSWSFIEVALHALEDMVAERIVDVRQSFEKQEDDTKTAAVIPQSVVTAAQSLKPYARSLSHELRTPMQGVVGMLEIMHATVSEALESPPNEDIKNIFKSLRDNIEIVQGETRPALKSFMSRLTRRPDSSRRAVDAADNVVHAYDLGMRVPDTPDPPEDDEAALSPRASPSNGMSLNEYGRRTGLKRSRSKSMERIAEPSAKHQALDMAWSSDRPISPRTASLRSVVEESEHITASSSRASETALARESQYELPAAPGLRVTNIRDVFRVIINECLRVGGRPDSAIAEDTEVGETIEVRTRCSSGEVATKTVDWAVERSVPEEVLIDGDLPKLVSVLFLNALKFTKQGKIVLNVTLGRSSRYVVVNVTDTGPGIPAAFRPYLFKPFSREEASITRSSEGLGLGLMVAQGLARRIGGDLSCVRSDTEGPRRGSEFLLRIPLHPSGGWSRHSTPSRTPTPSGDRSATPSTSNPRLLVRARQPSPTKQSVAAQASETEVPERPTSPLLPSSPSRQNVRQRSTVKTMSFDRHLARRCPLNILVAEDNRINRKLLISMLLKLGYTTVHEAYDGAEAVRLMRLDQGRKEEDRIDVILMDLWMPNMDGYEATERILAMQHDDDSEIRSRGRDRKRVKILAVTADVTGGALERAVHVGMVGHMTKPYKLIDLQKTILEHCAPGD